MIPSTRIRKVLLLTYLLVIATVLMATFAWQDNDSTIQPVYETFAYLIFVIGIYFCAPQMANFLAPVATTNTILQSRLQNIMKNLPGSQPIILYDHAAKEVNTVGLLTSHARIYMTTGFLQSMSNEGAFGAIAHENAHIRNHHLLLSLLFVCSFIILNHLVHEKNLLICSLLIFAALRRSFEYGADAEASKQIGIDIMRTALMETMQFIPSRKWHRWLCFASFYPTLPMRLKAIETGFKPLI